LVSSAHLRDNNKISMQYIRNNIESIIYVTQINKKYKYIIIVCMMFLNMESA
jgi:hypothetical protein